MNKLDQVTRRIDDSRVEIKNPYGVPVTLYANSDVHGAGRSLSRGKSRHVDEATYTKTFESLRVVTPINPNAPDIRLRRDVLAEYHARLKEEAPYAYKSITPVIQTVEDANIAKRVARLWPRLTIKG